MPKPPRSTSRARKPVPAPAPQEQAARHNTTRAAHAAEIAEDYAETIADLILRDGSARVTGLAACLGVSHVTVVRTLARLAREGLVVVRPYREVTLTPKGRAMAGRAKHRHEVVLKFLKALGISPAAAEADAEGIEHHVSAETLRAMERFVVA
ncbi:Transcriptional regulator MntR [Phycisphaerales bacterium]|nr:Transcriptional regulator MntR [Phycisphaerales bacterium]